MSSSIGIPLHKILLIGDSSCGKSSLLLRFIDDQFENQYMATIGVDFKVKIMEVQGQQIKLQIWDTAGQERFRTITSTGTNFVVIIFDLTNIQSFNHVSNWVEQVAQNTNSGVSIIIVGNKCDITDERRVVKREDAEKLAEKHNSKYFETSAKTNENVTELFNEVANLSYQTKKDQQGPERSTNIVLQNTVSKKKKCW